MDTVCKISDYDKLSKFKDIMDSMVIIVTLYSHTVMYT